MTAPPIRAMRDYSAELPSADPTWTTLTSKVHNSTVRFFEGATLKHANLSITNLIGAWLTNASLDYANLQNSLIRLARFQSASVVGVDFRHADLSGASFIDTDLSDSDLRWANLDSVKFTGVTCFGTRWPADFKRPEGCNQ